MGTSVLLCSIVFVSTEANDSDPALEWCLSE